MEIPSPRSLQVLGAFHRGAREKAAALEEQNVTLGGPGLREAREVARVAKEKLEQARMELDNEEPLANKAFPQGRFIGYAIYRLGRAPRRERELIKQQKWQRQGHALHC